MFKSCENRPGPPVPERTYSSSEVAQVANVSLRQLQWWDERKVVSPRHEGHRRLYGPGEVIEITVIAELRSKGFSLQKIRRVLRFLQREMGRRFASCSMHPPVWSRTRLLVQCPTVSCSIPMRVGRFRLRRNESGRSFS